MVLNTAGTLTLVDLYGPEYPGRENRGPTQDYTAGAKTSGAAGLGKTGKSSAMFWVGLVLLLVALRVVIELNDG